MSAVVVLTLVVSSQRELGGQLPSVDVTVNNRTIGAPVKGRLFRGLKPLRISSVGEQLATVSIERDSAGLWEAGNCRPARIVVLAVRVDIKKVYCLDAGQFDRLIAQDSQAVHGYFTRASAASERDVFYVFPTRSSQNDWVTFSPLVPARR
jgi:hypothetical protein